MRRMVRWLALLPLLGALGADWPQLLGPGRNGVSVETDLTESWPAKGPPVVWRRAVGEGYAGPVVAGGVLVLFHRVDDEDVVEALDARSGKGVWKYTYPSRYEDAYGKGNGPRSTPVIAKDRVFTLGAQGQLHCLELKSGRKLWARALHEEYTVPPSFFGVGTTPLAEGNLLLINVGGREAGIVALETETGVERWRASNDGASYASPIAATVDGVRHIFFFTRQGLLSVDPATGKVRFSKRWRSRIDASVNAATPVLVGSDHLFLSACYGTGAVLLKVRKDGVEEVWKNNTSLSCHFSTPVAVGEQLYGFDGRQEEGARLRAIDWKTGKVRWTEEGYGCGSVVACGKTLIVLGETGELALVKADAGRYEEKARARVLKRPVRAQPALAGGLLYARDDRELVCWRMRK